jgi:hypothetical protein
MEKNEKQIEGPCALTSSWRLRELGGSKREKASCASWHLNGVKVACCDVVVGVCQEDEESVCEPEYPQQPDIPYTEPLS